MCVLACCCSQDGKVERTIATLQEKLRQCDTSRVRAAARGIEAQTAALQRQEEWQRCCAVVDFDMFYAAVEIRDRPELADKPVAVGGIGMISTANYVARRQRATMAARAHA